MYKVYIKQAWQMLKEDKVISIITVSGTALAITMIMVIILTQRIKTINIGPEPNRERTMYIQYFKETNKKRKETNESSVKMNDYKQYLERLTIPEKVSMITKDQNDVCREGSDIYYRADVKYTDAAYWNIYSLSFIAGKPFSNEEFQSGISVAVVSKSLALKLFNETTGAIGNTFILNKKPYKVIGLVKDVPTLCNYAYAQIWVPYTSDAKYGNPDAYGYEVAVLAKNKSDFSKIKSEIRQSEVLNTIDPEEKEARFFGPFSGEELLIKINDMNYDEPDLMKGRLRYYLTLAILLLIPAINLSGFSLFKILNRTPEIGIRKAFGAEKKTILLQVLYENFLTSLIGGIIGLALSFMAVTLIKDQLFSQQLNLWTSDKFLGENTIPISAFISPWVFFYVILACILLNLLSSGIPAWRASRLNIVDAIHNS
ncbi:MAG: ABC transporter permease [Candidatus Azobacteroides sp.]|nr:ABC transporter permease [Candidatus Azobacteroides sp.]